MLDIVTNCHCMQFQGKHVIQAQANNLILGLIWKTLFWTWSEKPHFGPDLGPLDPSSGCKIFSKNLASLVTRYHSQVSSCKISEKTNDPILRKFSDGETGERQRFHKTLSDWCRVSNILVEILLFSEIIFVWTTSDLIGKHSF